LSSDKVNITMASADAFQAINLVASFRNYGNEVKILNSYLVIIWFVSFSSTSARIIVEDTEIYARYEKLNDYSSFSTTQLQTLLVESL